MSSPANEPAAHHKKCYTLFLIRHGEALHNVLEKQAKEEALAEAIEEGLDPQDEIVKLRQEHARMSILNNDSLQDCPLTPVGLEEALRAKEVIHQLTSTPSEDGESTRQRLPYPTQVFVSPLQRALQTADAIFPSHQSIHVREELRERQTLKACDTRQDSRTLSKRPEFARFSMNHLRLASMTKFSFPHSSFFEDLIADDEEGIDAGNEHANPSSNSLSASMASIACDLPTKEHLLNDDQKAVIKEEEVEEVADNLVELELQELEHDEVEEKHVLRRRTRRLFGLLGESKHRFIAVVAHKGYLRELERGPLNQPSAKEFKNCEVRVYRITLLPPSPMSSRGQECTNELDSVERLV